MGGGAILSQEWQHQVAGLVLLWYPGQEGGHALADVLLGRCSPSGRLPFTLPKRAEQLPRFEPRAQQVHYDLWHGYRSCSATVSALPSRSATASPTAASAPRRRSWICSCA